MTSTSLSQLVFSPLVGIQISSFVALPNRPPISIPLRGRRSEGVSLIFGRHPHLNSFDYAQDRLSPVEGEETREESRKSRQFSSNVRQSGKIQFSSFHSSQQLLEPIQHIRHIVRPVVVAAVDSAANIILVVNF